MLQPTNQWKRIFLIICGGCAGYCLSILSVVLAYTENDNFFVFKSRSLLYVEKSFLPFVIIGSLLAYLFLPGLLRAESLRLQILKTASPALLLALLVNLTFFLKEAFPGFDFSGVDYRISIWVLKQSIYGFLICLPALAFSVLMVVGILRRTSPAKKNI